MRKLILFCLCVAAPSAALAKDMSLAEYMARTEALVQRQHNQSTPEYIRLSEEVNEALWMARQERRIARKEGRAPRACLSPNVRATTNSELAKHFASIPAEQRASMTVAEAFMQLMERKFPCSRSS